MKKKSGKKKSVKHAPHKKTPKISNSHDSTIRALAENTIALQKVMTDVTIKLNGLSNNIEKLLELFGGAAKSLAEKDFSDDKSKFEREELIKKIDTLMEQNKIIARGLSFFSEKRPENVMPQQNIPQMSNPPNQSPQRQMPQPFSNQIPLAQPFNNQLQRGIMMRESAESETQFQEEIAPPTPEEDQDESEGYENFSDINSYDKQLFTRSQR
ncbi:MAG: hypothetical protein Q7S56_02835 [Nanoarchaeota archaeon]|nr:hypothetical protein [Nanoarchaeota archaeon]